MLRSDYLSLAQSPEWDLMPEELIAVYLMERPHSLDIEGNLIKVSTIDDSIRLTRDQLDHVDKFRAVACVRSAA